MNDISTRVCGIPCLVRVTEYSAQAPHRGSAYTCDSDLDYYGYEEIEYEICDRRGRPAPWLARKLKPDDDIRIKKEISQFMEEDDEY